MHLSNLWHAVDEQMNKEADVNIYSGILLSLKKKEICKNMDGP